jgi:hypothetical protein
VGAESARLEGGLRLGTGAFRVRLLLAAILLMLIAPTAAAASPFVMEWSIISRIESAMESFPGISGDHVIYSRTDTSTVVAVFDLVTGSRSLLQPADGQSMLNAKISGDWVVWTEGLGIWARNLKGGPARRVTDFGGYPSVSTVDGAYVVWGATDGTTANVYAKNLATNGKVFMLTGGPYIQTAPVVYGKRVAYVDDSNGHYNVCVKTIGSSAPPTRITDGPYDISSQSIGSHLVAWRVDNGSGQQVIRYYDFDTGMTYDGPSSTVYDMGAPYVSGDRILYSTGDISNHLLCVWDTRIAKTSPGSASFLVAEGGWVDGGAIDGNQIAYSDGSEILYARLAVPSIALNSVPARIPHNGHIHLKGSISDQGIRIGGATLGIEKYASGKWTRIKTITASSTGSFSYQTPHNHSKTKYRVVYDGHVMVSEVPWTNHLSTVSAVKTAWPR